MKMSVARSAVCVLVAAGASVASGDAASAAIVGPSDSNYGSGNTPISSITGSDGGFYAQYLFNNTSGIFMDCRAHNGSPQQAAAQLTGISGNSAWGSTLVSLINGGANIYGCP